LSRSIDDPGSAGKLTPASIRVAGRPSGGDGDHRIGDDFAEGRPKTSNVAPHRS
jgi:hypothetical protein